MGRKPDYVDNALAERDAEIAERGIAIASLKAELADSQSDVAQLLTTVEQQRQYIERLRQQVAELQAWKGAVPVVGIKRLFRDAPYDASYADEVWQWIEKYTLNR